MAIPKELRWRPTGKTLGEGGQSRIYLVEDASGVLEGQYALKELKQQKPGQALDRFIQEITAVSQLDHPRIIKIFDHFRTPDSYAYYVMEYIEGAKPLMSIMKSGKSPYYSDPIPALNVFQQICQGLEACNTNDPIIYHRDLSPKNILICSDGSLKLIDFGVCQIVGNERLTLTDEGVGSVNYMPPECESGSSGQTTSASDLYSAGKILWSAITGQVAFSRENPAFTEKSMKELFPWKPETWHLHHIFEKTIRSNPQDRWHTAGIAVSAAIEITQLITSGYPPLEQLGATCAICGVGQLTDMGSDRYIFHNPPPKGIVALECDYCGHCFPVRYKTLKANLNKRKDLQ